MSGLSHVLILPRTQAGRDLLRLVLPDARSPDREDGELPDGSSIYGMDFDKAAIWAEREAEAYERWCREQGEKK